MKAPTSSVLALAIGLTCSTAALAQGMDNTQYKARGQAIDADYKAARTRCDIFAGNAKDVCVADAKGRRDVAQAELDFNDKPSAKTQYKAQVAKADAIYAVAVERCDDKAGNDKTVCVKEAKASQIHAEADAKALMKTYKANAAANEKVADANLTAMTKIADARQDANADKRSADFAVAKAKCEVLAGSAKDQCVSDAKARFGQ